MNNIQNIELLLEIDDRLSLLIDSDSVLNKKICIEISEGASKIFKILGLPGKLKVFIKNLKKEKVLPNRFMRIVINGQQCRYPDELLILVQNYVIHNKTDGQCELGRNISNVFNWLINIIDAHGKKNPTISRSVIEFFSVSCLEIVKLQPEILLGSSQIDVYLSEALISSDQRGRIRKILSKVLNHRISIADKQKIKEIFEEGVSKYRSDDDIIEDLLVALRPDIIKIEISKDYLKEIINTQQNNTDMFKMARDGLFYEIGVRYPDFQFTINEDLNPYSFACTINHLTTLPQICIKPDKLLVNDTTERLKILKIDAKPTINPANLSESSIIHTKDGTTAEKAGLSTWDHMEYFILSFSAILKKYGSYFIHFDRVSEDLDEFSYTLSSFALSFPDLANFIKRVVSVETITRVLRNLVSEEVSIRNLRDILESILEFYQKSDFNQTTLRGDVDGSLALEGEENAYKWGDKEDYLINFVRSSLNHQISHKFSSRDNILVVNLLGPTVETFILDFLSNPGNRDQTIQTIYKKLLTKIREDLNDNILLNTHPILLTKVDLRSLIREIVVPECPRIVVLAYNEIHSDFKIQPIGMVTIPIYNNK